MAKWNLIKNHLAEVIDIVFNKTPSKNHGQHERRELYNYLWSFYGTMTSVDHDRKIRYLDYESMLSDGIAGGALELLVEDSAIYSKLHRATMWLETNVKDYKREWDRFINIINLEDNLIDWTWQTALYGDMFIKLYGEPGKGITGYDDQHHPEDVYRFDVNGKLLGFALLETAGFSGAIGADNLLEPWEVVHFRLLGPRRKYRLLDREKIFGALKLDEKGHPLRLTTKYGISFFEAARKIFKQLKLSQDSIIMARLARAPFIRVFYVNVGNANTTEATDMLNDYEETFKKSKSINFSADQYYSEYNPLNFTDDLFLPVTASGKGDVKADTIGGDVEVRGMVDIDYFTKIYFGALRTPPEYLGFTNEGFQVGEGSLKWTSLRYARMSKRLQNADLIAMKRMFLIHLSWKYKKVINPNEFDVMLGTTSTAEELELTNALKSQLDVSREVLDFFRSIGIENDAQVKYVIYWLLKYLSLPEFDVKSFMTNKIDFQTILTEIKKDKQELKYYHRNGDIKSYLPYKIDVNKKRYVQHKIIEKLDGKVIIKKQKEDGEE